MFRVRHGRRFPHLQLRPVQGDVPSTLRRRRRGRHRRRGDALPLQHPRARRGRPLPALFPQQGDDMGRPSVPVHRRAQLPRRGPRRAPAPRQDRRRPRAQDLRLQLRGRGVLHQTDTVANPKGLCALSPTQGNTVMAYPGLNKGQVRVELYDAGVTKFISAHDGDLAGWRSASTANGSPPRPRRAPSSASTTRRRPRCCTSSDAARTGPPYIPSPSRRRRIFWRARAIRVRCTCTRRRAAPAGIGVGGPGGERGTSGRGSRARG